MKRWIVLFVAILVAVTTPAFAEGVTYYGHVYSEVFVDVDNRRVFCRMEDDGRAYVRVPEELSPEDFAYRGVRITLPAQTVFFGTDMVDAEEIIPTSVQIVPLVGGTVRGVGLNYLVLDVTKDGPIHLDEPEIVHLVLTDETVIPWEITEGKYAAVLYDEETSEVFAVFVYEEWGGFRPSEGV